MAAPLSIATGAISIVSLSCSLISSVVSTFYDMAKASRDMLNLQRELQNVKQVLESIEGLVGHEDEKLDHVPSLSDSCEDISQICGNFFVGSPLFRPKLLQPTTKRNKYRYFTDSLLRTLEELQKSRKDERMETRRLLKTCGKIVGVCQRDASGHPPALWKLQTQITGFGDRVLRLIGIQLPSSWHQPPIIVLLTSWLILGLAITAYFGTYSNHRNRKAVLIGSAFVALFSGLMEGSSMSSIILTTLPWCLTIGILLDILLYRFIGVYCRISWFSYPGTKTCQEDIELLTSESRDE